MLIMNAILGDMPEESMLCGNHHKPYDLRKKGSGLDIASLPLGGVSSVNCSSPILPSRKRVKKSLSSSDESKSLITCNFLFKNLYS